MLSYPPITGALTYTCSHEDQSHFHAFLFVTSALTSLQNKCFVSPSWHCLHGEQGQMMAVGCSGEARMIQFIDDRCGDCKVFILRIKKQNIIYHNIPFVPIFIKSVPAFWIWFCLRLLRRRPLPMKDEEWNIPQICHGRHNYSRRPELEAFLEAFEEAKIQEKPKKNRKTEELFAKRDPCHSLEAEAHRRRPSVHVPATWLWCPGYQL